MKKDYLITAQNLLTERFSKAKAAFVAGSVIRKEATPSSDIDFVIVYDTALLPKAYRHSLIREGWPIELFVQNTNSVAYFFKQEIACGFPALIDMVAHGMIGISENDYAFRLQEKALELERAGPASLSVEEINQRRYGITDILDDIVSYKTVSELHGSLCQLYQELADFYLRANQKWSGRGKSLVRAFKKAFPELSGKYETAFEQAFGGNVKPLSELADHLLLPFGGRLWANWKSYACDEADQYSPNL